MLPSDTFRLCVEPKAISISVCHLTKLHQSMSWCRVSKILVVGDEHCGPGDDFWHLVARAEKHQILGKVFNATHKCGMQPSYHTWRCNGPSQPLLSGLWRVEGFLKLPTSRILNNIVQQGPNRWVFWATPETSEPRHYGREVGYSNSESGELTQSCAAISRRHNNE